MQLLMSTIPRMTKIQRDQHGWKREVIKLLFLKEVKSLEKKDGKKDEKNHSVFKLYATSEWHQIA